MTVPGATRVVKVRLTVKGRAGKTGAALHRPSPCPFRSRQMLTCALRRDYARKEGVMGDSETTPTDGVNPIHGFDVREIRASDGSLKIELTVKVSLPYRHRVFADTPDKFQDLVRQLRNLPHWEEKPSQ